MNYKIIYACGYVYEYLIEAKNHNNASNKFFNTLQSEEIYDDLELFCINLKTNIVFKYIFKKETNLLSRAFISSDDIRFLAWHDFRNDKPFSFR